MPKPRGTGRSTSVATTSRDRRQLTLPRLLKWIIPASILAVCVVAPSRVAAAGPIGGLLDGATGAVDGVVEVVEEVVEPVTDDGEGSSANAEIEAATGDGSAAAEPTEAADEEGSGALGAATDLVEPVAES